MFKKEILCFTFLLILTDVVRCKPDYIFNNEVDGWLKLHTVPATWEEAYLRCHYEGAVLASPLNVQLAHTLHKLMTELKGYNRIFLGTHALYSPGDFFSVDGVPLADMPISWGADGASTGDCLLMQYDGNLYDMLTFSCAERLPYICYRKKDKETKLNSCGTFDNKYRLDERTGSCYKLHETQQTWNRAQMICAAEGGYLAILNNKKEADIVKGMFPTRVSPNKWEPMHTGLRAWNDHRTWLTIHGEPLEKVYNTWAPNQPDNSAGRQSWGSFVRDGTLDDVWSASLAIFVCEKDPHTSRFAFPPTNAKSTDEKTDAKNKP